MTSGDIPVLTNKSDAEIDSWIHNQEQSAATMGTALYRPARGARAAQPAERRLSLDGSLELLTQAAKEQRYVTYGDLGKASGIDWSKARHKMNARTDILIACSTCATPAVCPCFPRFASTKVAGKAVNSRLQLCAASPLAFGASGRA